MDPNEEGTLRGSASCAPDVWNGVDVVCFPKTDGASCEASWNETCVKAGYSCGLNQRGDRIGCTITSADACCWLVFGLCEIGRPLLVEGVARVAGLRAGSGWSERRWPTLHGLDVVTREALAEHWAHEAATEHASAAAFARVVMELLAVGAPASLVAATQRALADELAHATSAFGFASAYAGQELAPGPLDVSRALVSQPDLASVMLGAWREGCVAETVSALIIARAAELATDPVVRAALLRTAEEEAEHVELAWRTVAWALREGGAPLRALLARELDDVAACVSLGAPAPRRGDATLLVAHGCLPTSERNEVAHRTLREVVLVAARALLDEPAAEAVAVPLRV